MEAFKVCPSIRCIVLCPCCSQRGACVFGVWMQTITCRRPVQQTVIMTTGMTAMHEYGDEDGNGDGSGVSDKANMDLTTQHNKHAFKF